MLKEGSLMTDPDKADAVATERWHCIAPLVEDAVDAALRRQRATQIAAQTGLSDRTLRRWVAQYQAGGLAGLRPRPFRRRCWRPRLTCAVRRRTAVCAN